MKIVGLLERVAEQPVHPFGPSGLPQLRRRRIDRPGGVALESQEFGERVSRALFVLRSRRELGVPGQDVRTAATGNVFLQDGEGRSRLPVFLVVKVRIK